MHRLVNFHIGPVKKSLYRLTNKFLSNPQGIYKGGSRLGLSLTLTRGALDDVHVVVDVALQVLFVVSGMREEHHPPRVAGADVGNINVGVCATRFSTPSVQQL